MTLLTEEPRLSAISVWIRHRSGPAATASTAGSQLLAVAKPDQTLQLAARVCVHRALFSSSISVWQEGKAHMTAWKLGLASTVGLPWAADSDWSKGQKCKSKWWTGAVAAIVTG